MSASIAAPWARSAGQPDKSKQSHFLRMQKIPKQKEKAPAGKFICQAGACFSQGLRNGDQKKAKKMVHPAGFEPTTFYSGGRRSYAQKC